MGRTTNEAARRGRGSHGFLQALLAGACLTAGAVATPAWAADAAPAKDDPVVQEVIVTGARNMTGVIQKVDGTAAFGIDKPLVETPRSVTAISDLLLDRYNIKSVYDFTAVAAGTYTGSYFGVPGSLNIRGTIADTYFHGFQQIANFATYPTPVDASSNIDLVRGPPSPVYGAGQIGGYMNFMPKSAIGGDAKYLSHPTGAASFTVGSYNQKEGTVEGGAPFTLGGQRAGLYGFLEVVDSDSFYLGMHPKSQTAQVSFNTELGPHWNLSSSFQYIHSTGYLKDIGWNRVTQNLIDNGLYISGTASKPIVQPGEAYITPADFAAAGGLGFAKGIQQYVIPLYGITATPNAYTTLDPSTVKLVKLSPRQTEVSPLDINNASTPTFYIGLKGDIGEHDTLNLESFTQHLNALNYQSYGFATRFDTTVNEERVTLNDKRDFGDALSLQSSFGVSYRYTDAYGATYLNSGVNVQDRWDLSQPQTPDEIFNAVFRLPNYGGYQWDNEVHSKQQDVAVFLLVDALMFNHLDLTAGVRDDNYTLKSADFGTLGSKTWYKQTASPVSYNVSISYKNPWVVPYFTYARSFSLNIDQSGAVSPTFVQGHNAIGVSTLTEGGLKTSQLGGRLYAAVDYFRQTNQYVNIFSNAIDSKRSEGFEGELRYLATKHLGLTGTVTVMDVRQLASGSGNGAFLIITPEQAGITGVQGYGGMYETNAAYLGLGNGYALHTTPHVTSSLFATYDFNGRWGLTGGFTYNSWTGGSVPGSIRLPAYTLVKLGAYVAFKGVRADLYVDNAFDKRYFLAEYDVDSNATVLPGVGREFHFKLSTRF